MRSARSITAALALAVIALAFVRGIFTPGTTAEGVAAVRHILTLGGLCTDNLAKHFMPARAALMEYTIPFGIPVWIAAFASELRAPMLLSNMATREAWYESQILTLMRKDPQIRQLVICGAGFDTRAYRLPLPEGVRVFELDKPSHPGVQSYKRQQLKRAGIDTSHVSFLPIDFEHEDVADVLEAGGHDAQSPTIFVWEGVTMYLSRDAIRRNVQSFQRRAVSDSFLLTEIYDAAFLDYDAMRHHPVWGKHWQVVLKSGEAFRFGLAPRDMKPFWRSLDTQPVDHYEPEEQQQAWRKMLQTVDSRSPFLWLPWMRQQLLGMDSTVEDQPLGGASHMFTIKLK